MEGGLCCPAPERDSHLRHQRGRCEAQQQSSSHGVQRRGDRGQGLQEALPVQDDANPAQLRRHLCHLDQRRTGGLDFLDQGCCEPDMHPRKQAQGDAGEQHAVQGVQRHCDHGRPDNPAPPQRLQGERGRGRGGGRHEPSLKVVEKDDVDAGVSQGHVHEEPLLVSDEVHAFSSTAPEIVILYLFAGPF